MSSMFFFIRKQVCSTFQSLNRVMLGLLSILYVFFILSCSPSTPIVLVHDWNDSLAMGPLKIIITTEPNSGVEIERIDFYTADDHARLYLRIVDTLGNLYRLPRHAYAKWSLLGANEDRQVYIQARDETETLHQNLTSSGIYTEGQYLHVAPRAFSSNKQFEIHVKLVISSDYTYENLIPLVYHFNYRR